jgi:hypothetical protein
VFGPRGCLELSCSKPLHVLKSSQLLQDSYLLLIDASDW